MPSALTTELREGYVWDAGYGTLAILFVKVMQQRTFSTAVERSPDYIPIALPAASCIWIITTTTHTFCHCNTHTFMQNTTTRNWSWEMVVGVEALYAGRGRRNPVWSGKEAHWSLRGLIVKSTEHCDTEYKPLDR